MHSSTATLVETSTSVPDKFYQRHQPICSNKSVSTTATAARNCNTVTESQPDEPEEKIQVQEQDIGESHQLQSSPLSALGLSTEANTVKESQSTRQDISPTNFGDSTAKVVHEICGTERNELRRKAQVLTASLQQAKRNNMDVSYQQHQLEELQSELCRLLHIEAQLKEYEKRKNLIGSTGWRTPSAKKDSNHDVVAILDSSRLRFPECEAQNVAKTEKRHCHDAYGHSATRSNDLLQAPNTQ
ncbi:unnamed protein product [Peronospora belbahrii]|uniref:Uncharacterized protein n=1 Tax=Peronospora belbahrii TaxID=622444 RepID=A0AAU9KWV9_9STRA|nr:unnamed protein product [Peronospora belbahrii]